MIWLRIYLGALAFSLTIWTLHCLKSEKQITIKDASIIVLLSIVPPIGWFMFAAFTLDDWFKKHKDHVLYKTKEKKTQELLFQKNKK